jgi:hypothetical protein
MNLLEKRRFGRRETNFAGWIRIPDRASHYCTVRDVSIGGAFLECEYPSLLPFRFKLEIPAIGTTYDCEARHCRDGGLGVEFLRTSAHDRARRQSRADSSPEITEHRAETARLVSAMRYTFRERTRQ